MPKVKTKKSVKKRFKVSSRGKLMRRSANLGHLLSGRNAKRKRILKQTKAVSEGDAKKIRVLLGK